MDHKAHYQALVEFLLPYQEIWRNEIMLMYPRSVEAFPAHWIAELTRYIDPDSTWRLAQGEFWQELSPELSAFDQAITHLTTFPVASPHAPLPVKPHSWVHIIPKKQHELERLAPLVHEAMSELKLERLVDIGGGQAHLAQTVAHHYGVKALSLDLDPELQNIGRRWQTFKWEESPHAVEFQLHKVTRNDADFCALLSPQSLTTGLHTCGSLAVAHLEAAAQARAAVMNLGCCYHKTELTDVNLSQTAQVSPLPLGLYALTLASGAHTKTSLADAQFRAQVKRFRYCLHFLLCDELGMCGPVVLGNCPEKLYYGPFADYAREQLQRLNVSCAWSDAWLDEFFQRPRTQELIDQMFAAGIIRDRLGRVVEAAVLVDRALWLEEQGFVAKILQVFDARKSPRNLMIYAHPT